MVRPQKETLLAWYASKNLQKQNSGKAIKLDKVVGVCLVVLPHVISFEYSLSDHISVGLHPARC